ncbi:Uncharacterised protein [Mycobacteroides abscessus subsp. massiliense]|nr:Uncharacterised protein [Mycobacteroides abscessus subsp. massiliense]
MIEVVISPGGRRSLEHAPDPDTTSRYIDPLSQPGFVVILDDYMEVGGTIPRGIAQEESIPDGTKDLVKYKEGKI